MVRIYTPQGAVGTVAISPASPRPVLAGARIGILDNGKPNAGALLERLAHKLSARSGAEVTSVETKNAAQPAPAQVLERLIDGVDVVLTGTAD